MAKRDILALVSAFVAKALGIGLGAALWIQLARMITGEPSSGPVLSVAGLAYVVAGLSFALGGYLLGAYVWLRLTAGWLSHDESIIWLTMASRIPIVSSILHRFHAAQSPYPTLVMAQVAWVFDGEQFADRETFFAAVTQYQREILGYDTWMPQRVVLYTGRVTVSYFGIDKPTDVEYTHGTIELASDNARYFIAGELLFKLHNALVAYLRDADHRFFEGLRLQEA
ncbi:MAG: hypothetical protein H7Z74_12940, partial [Anaerolineae bacterium]|nr:hypothetical protein [Gemmatimonadaceae bacterium]